MPTIVAAFRHNDSPRAQPGALADLLTRPALAALTRTWYSVSDKDKAHTESTPKSVAERFANPEAHAVGLDSGRSGELVAKAMFDIGLPYTPDADVVAPLRSHVIVPYDAATAGAVIATMVSIGELLRPVWGMISVEPTFDIAEKAAVAKGPAKDQRSAFPHLTDDRIRYRRAPWFHDKKIDRGIGGPEWGTFLGPKHVEKLALDKLRESGAFTQVRELSHGGVYVQLSEEPLDATSDKIVALVSNGRAALEPILLDVTAVKL